MVQPLNSTSPAPVQTLTQQLAAWSAALQAQQLPPDVLELAKDCLLDHVAVALHGMRQPWSRQVAALARAEAGAPEASLYGLDLKVPARAAALVNGTAAHAFELDDWHAGSLAHLGACVIPAVLAVAEQERLPGRQALLALVAGFEVMARAGMSVVPSVIIHGFHPTGAHGPMGAAAGVARLLDFSAAQTTSAIGIAASCAAGLMEFSQDSQGMMVKRLHAGRAAESGVLAARLAGLGMTGPKSALDGKFGYAQVFSRAPRPEELTRELGQDFQIRHNNIKLYASCGALHAGMDIVAELMAEHGFEAGDVQAMVFGGNQSHMVRHTHARPDSVMAAQYSMPYALAVALQGRSLDARSFDEGAFDDPERLRLAGLVRMELHPEVEAAYPDKLGAHLTVHLRDGRTLSRTRLQARGAGTEKISRAEILDKAGALCGPFLRPQAMRRLFDAVLAFEKAPDVAELGALMREAAQDAGSPRLSLSSPHAAAAMPAASATALPENSELLRRLDRLESRHQIAELVGDYARACDDHDIDRLAEIFTEDGCIDSPTHLLSAQGRQGIRETFFKRYRIRGPSYHWTHDHRVSFDEHDPDLATGLVLGHAETSPGQEVSIAALRYSDVYRREQGVWRFARRTVRFLYYVPVRDYPGVLASQDRITVAGKRLPGDYPESLPSWRKVLEAPDPS